MKIIQGDLIKLAEEGQFDIIVHGCNCFTNMGSGIARQIRETYPGAYQVDARTVIGDKLKLGTFTCFDTGKFIIINAYTQYLYNKAGETRDMFEYEEFDKILNTLAEKWPSMRFGFPLIGCGLAGGDKARILTSLVNFSKIVEDKLGSVTVVEYQP